MKNITINTKQMIIVFSALTGAGIRVDTLISYLLDLVFGGPNHDFGNAIAVEIRGVVTRMMADPIGFATGVAVDVAIASAVLAAAGYLVRMMGGKTSIRIAKGVTWKFL